MKEGFRCHCSRCGRSFKRDSKEFPFCTKRCRLLDLRDWLNGNHCFPAEEVASEVLSEDGYDL